MVEKLFLFWVITFLSCCCSAAEENSVLKEFPSDANQGVAVDDKFFYGISNTKIVKYEKKSGKIISTWKADTKQKAFAHFKHLNSGAVINGKLYCAHSRFGVDPNDNSLEIWDVTKEQIKHLETIRLPRKYGSFTWIDKHPDGSWWMCFAVYGKTENKKTRLVKYKFADNEFIEEKSWQFPVEVANEWGSMSCSGGSWGKDGFLYTTGHDHEKAFVLKVEDQKLELIRVEKNLDLYGQGIAWDRFEKEPILWGIKKRKKITKTLIPEKK